VVAALVSLSLTAATVWATLRGDRSHRETMMANCVAMARKPSVDFCGYWQEHISALLRVFNFEQTEVCKQSHDG
jgi:hypothetical protein